jgi:hypothetical protein
MANFLIAVSTDWAWLIIGKIWGMVTLIQQETSKLLLQIWCSLNQFDFAIQQVFKRALNNQISAGFVD